MANDKPKWPTNFPSYGRGKGAPIAGAPQGDLDYYANGARRSIADPAKEHFRAKEQALLDAIEAEIARQGGAGSGVQTTRAPGGGYGGGEMLDNTPPGGGPADDDVAFCFRETRLDRP